ncbi:thioesterase II family protein [Nocardia sp. NPDC050175]|uniref:thioesterase II family protein n=1 Tax=Nocardia sp. NPDC050175 TaxID=3364317 RepID=UPI0037A2D045
MNAPAIDARKWMPYPSAGGAPTTLYCLPHAGAGASTYLPWRKELQPDVDVVPLQPPGREMRMRDEPFENLTPLLNDLLAAMDGVWQEPFALFGHSLGALVAFELARRLSAGEGPRPAHLIVSGRRAPQHPSRLPWIRMADDPMLLEIVRRLGGTPDEILDDEQMRQTVLTLMRADLGVDQTYRYRPDPPLDVPITVLSGSTDSHVTMAELEPWAECGSAGVDIRLVPGGHFFVVTQRETVLRRVRHCLVGSP